MDSETVTLGEFMALPLKVRVELSRRWKGLRGAKYDEAVLADVREAQAVEHQRKTRGQGELFTSPA